MFNFFKKNPVLIKREIESRNTFIEAISKPFLSDSTSWDRIDIKNSEKSKLGLHTYLFDPLDCYFDKETAISFGCVKLQIANEDLITNFIFGISEKKTYVMCMFNTSKTHGSISNLDLTKRDVGIYEINDEMKECLSQIDSFAKFNNYSSPPPHINSISLYQKSSIK